MFALKSALVGCAALAASAAFGSFDMLLQADSDTTLGDHIDRYDPVSRVYLGAFTVFGAPTSIVASSAKNFAYVKYGASNIDVFNYSTGEYVRTFFSSGPVMALNAAQDKLYTLSGGSLRIVDLNNYSSSTVTLSGVTTSSCLTVSSTGRIIVADDTTLTIKSFTSAGTLLQSIAYGAYTTVKQIALRQDSGNLSSNTFRMTTNSAGVVYGLTESISLGTLGLGSTLLTGYNAPTGIVSAHEGLYTIGVRAAAPTTLTATRMNTAGALGTPFNLSQTTSLTGQSAIVLAPEPGAFVALGFGIIPLLLKRKKK